jgi:anti-anti-sigma factor
MKSHLTTLDARRRKKLRTAAPPPAERHRAEFDEVAHRRPLASVRTRSHTLIPTGELDHHSAHTLEAEIERLCEEGVTTITLDLRELRYIDVIGVAVVAFRSELCKRRGHGFYVIPGSRIIHRAMEQAGVSDLLLADRPDYVARRLAPPAVVDSGSGTGEV